jgi:hypothetical protein
MSEDTEQAEKGEDQEDEKSELEKEEEAAEAEVAKMEDDPPMDLQEWPDGDAKYKTFGGPDAETGYEDGPTAKLGPADVRHHEDGSVSVQGEKVDNPEDYKGEPIPGGPTDPDTAGLAGDKADPEDASTYDEDDDDRSDEEKDGGEGSSDDQDEGSGKDEDDSSSEDHDESKGDDSGEKESHDE